jgi:hypothetical protein
MVEREKWRWLNKRKGPEREGSHVLQGRQRRVHSHRTREAGGSRVADPVVAKAGKITRAYHNLTRAGEVSRVDGGTESRGGQIKRKRSERRVRTYYKAVRVAFTRTASARLVTPGTPIRLLLRLKGSPRQPKPPYRREKLVG